MAAAERVQGAEPIEVTPTIGAAELVRIEREFRDMLAPPTYELTAEGRHELEAARAAGVFAGA